MQRPDVHIMTRPPEGSERTSILTINTYDALSWNNTLLQCVVHYGTQDILSQYVALVIYTSLSILLIMISACRYWNEYSVHHDCVYKLLLVYQEIYI